MTVLTKPRKVKSRRKQLEKQRWNNSPMKPLSDKTLTALSCIVICDEILDEQEEGE